MNGTTLAAGATAKTFITLTTPDDRNRVWISKSDRQGRVRIIFSFGLKGRLPLVDDIDRLPYVSVLEVSDIDTECSGMVLQFTDPHPGHLARLTDDLCELLHRYLPADDANMATPLMPPPMKTGEMIMELHLYHLLEEEVKRSGAHVFLRTGVAEPDTNGTWQIPRHRRI